MNRSEFLDLIPQGADNAISAQKLALLSGHTLRENRKAIENLRGQGVLICSRTDKHGGYYMPANDIETEEYFMRQLSRIGHIWKALAPFKKYVKNLPAAEQLDLWTEMGDFE